MPRNRKSGMIPVVVLVVAGWFAPPLPAQSSGPTAFSGSPNAARDSARTLFLRAADAMGGRTLLAQLPELTTSYHLIERSLGQEEWPNGPAASSLQLGDREYQPRTPRERLTMRRHMSGGRIYNRVLDAGRWHGLLTSTDSSIHFPGVEGALSAALAAVHPEALLPRLLADDAVAVSQERPRVVAGRDVSSVRARVGRHSLDLHFDRNGLLRAVEWNDPELGIAQQESIRVVFSEYRRAVAIPGEPRLPHLVEVWRGSRVWQVRSYAEYRVGGSIGDAMPTTIPRRNVAVEIAELAPTVWQLRGSDYTSLVADVGDRVLLVEVPESLDRARAVLQVARERAAGRPISVVVTHLHEDHVAGLAAVADLEIIAQQRIAEQVRSIIRRSRPGADSRVRAIADRERFGSGDAVVDLMAIDHSHAEGMLIAFVPAAGFLYEVDLIRGLLPHSTNDLVAWIDARGLDVRHVASSHGTVTPWSRVVAAAATWRAGLNRDSLSRP